ncbi:MAG TPA: hypothetical protein VJ625_08645 [Propionibacteriaceae bacterium]|nr:hypothetical protein [Propionibacteriaceae bacterium]
MIVLSVILSLSSFFPKISIVFWTIGLIILGIGVVFLILGRKGRTLGGRRYPY